MHLSTKMFEMPFNVKVQYYETVISLLMTEEGPWYLFFFLT